ncbi:MAG: protein kinase [Planctomycetota bacterium]|jgi:hypothetical protein|nr:protein kinase [Planctomycetota bacterium]
MVDNDSQAISLVCTHGPLQGKKFELVGGPVFIFGRYAKAHFNLSDDSSISHLHFLIDVSDNRIRIIDLGSTNGLMVNTRRLGGRDRDSLNAFVSLRHGDVILAGSSLFRVSVGGETPLPSPELGAAEIFAAAEREPLRQDNLTAVVPLKDQSELDSPVRREPMGEFADGLPKIEGYTVTARLPGGGDRELFRAIKEDSGAAAAIKMLRIFRNKAKTLRRLDIFRRETEIAKLLNHPNVIRYFSDGLWDDRPYLAVEYVEGGALENLIGRNPGAGMGFYEAAPLFVQLLEAVAAMHEARLCHRNINPGNILLDRRRGGGLAVKLSSLGLASRSPDTGGGDDFPPLIHEWGMPAYLPPEQLTDLIRTIPQSDVFSAAAVFFHMLTGVEVYDFSGRDRKSGVLSGSLRSLPELRPELDSEVVKVLSTALDPDPNQRYPDAGEFLSDFRQALS